MVWHQANERSLMINDYESCIPNLNSLEVENNIIFQLNVLVTLSKKLDFAFATFVLKMKEIVTFMTSVKMVLFVDQTIVQLHLVLTQKLIVVINQHLEMKIFVHLEFLAKKMKEIVTFMMSVKMVLLVDQTIVQLHLVLTQKLIVVIILLNAIATVHLQFLVG